MKVSRGCSINGLLHLEILLLVSVIMLRLTQFVPSLMKPAGPDRLLP